MILESRNHVVGMQWNLLKSVVRDTINTNGSNDTDQYSRVMVLTTMAMLNWICHL